MVSAHENDTIYGDDNSQSDNLKDLIDECEDNGVVNLEEGTYHLDGENQTRIVLNKTITVEGIDGKTVIEGENSTLILDVNSTEKKVEKDIISVGLWRDGYVFKYLGKNVTFKNITFKDLKIITYHEMTFENCRFINSTFTSYEYSNTFTNCDFNTSTIELVVFYGFGDIYKDYSKIIGCNLYESLVTFKAVYTPNYIEIVGGDQFRVINRLDVKDTRFSKSNMTLSRYNVTIDNSSFENSNIYSGSSIYNISNTVFDSPKIMLSYSEISLYKSNLTDPKLHFSAGYFSNGCRITMDRVILENCKMEGSISYGSRPGSLKITESTINNSTLYTMESDVFIGDSIFNNSTIELFFSNLGIINSTFANDANVTDTIRTRDCIETYLFDDDGKGTRTNEKVQVKTNYTAENSYLVNGSGKYEITAEDINKDTTHKIIVNETQIYYFNDKLVIRLVDYMGNPVSGVEIFIEDMNAYEYPIPSAITDKNGTAKYSLSKPRNVSLKIYYSTRKNYYHDICYGIDVNLTVKPTISAITVKKVNFNKNIYSQIGGRLDVGCIANSSADLKDIRIAYKVYTNGKPKTYYSKTDSKGKTTFSLPKTLTAGKHTIEIWVLNTNVKKTVTFTVSKAKTIVKAPKLTAKVKKSRYFKATIKNKATKKVVSNVKVKIKVYTGKKYKTYTVKTNKKGIAKINTKKLKTGNHKVVISSGNANYQIKAKSTITITK